LEVSLQNRPAEIILVHRALDELAARHGMTPRLVTHLHVALEEHLTNIISYGYDPGQPGTIRVRFTLEGSVVRVEVEDDARPFDPVKAPAVDTSLPLDAKPIGGLGLHMIRKSADCLEYLRIDNHNVLTLTKRIK
jgi:anti-sigma regulatory factor (Ser/Thr protein kinase)